MQILHNLLEFLDCYYFKQVLYNITYASEGQFHERFDGLKYKF